MRKLGIVRRLVGCFYCGQPCPGDAAVSLLHLIRRRRLAAELLAEYEAEEWEYLTTEHSWARMNEAVSRFLATHNSQPPGTGARKWREAVEAKLGHFPE